jgi:hypothetical protein
LGGARLGFRGRVSTEGYRWRALHGCAAKGGPLLPDGGGCGPGVKGAALRFAAFRVASRWAAPTLDSRTSTAKGSQGGAAPGESPPDSLRWVAGVLAGVRVTTARRVEWVVRHRLSGEPSDPHEGPVVAPTPAQRRTVGSARAVSGWSGTGSASNCWWGLRGRWDCSERDWGRPVVFCVLSCVKATSGRRRGFSPSAVWLVGLM